jgi:hypothetical protein
MVRMYYFSCPKGRRFISATGAVRKSAAHPTSFDWYATLSAAKMAVQVR